MDETTQLMYIVPENEFKKYETTPTVTFECIENFPPLKRKKLEAILKHFQSQDIFWNRFGIAVTITKEFDTPFNILLLTEFCLQSSGKPPEGVSEFIQLLHRTKINTKLVSARTRRLIDKFEKSKKKNDKKQKENEDTE